MNEETGKGKSWDKEIVKGNDENVKTIDGNLDESKADQTELMKVELSKFDETGICKTGEKWKLWKFCERGGWFVVILLQHPLIEKE